METPTPTTSSAQQLEIVALGKKMAGELAKKLAVRKFQPVGLRLMTAVYSIHLYELVNLVGSNIFSRSDSSTDQPTDGPNDQWTVNTFSLCPFVMSNKAPCWGLSA